MNGGTITLKVGDLVTLYGEMWKAYERIPALNGKHVKRGSCIFPMEECEEFDSIVRMMRELPRLAFAL